MMQKAGRVHGLRSALAALMLVVLIVGGREIFGRIKAKSLVEQLASANIGQVREIVEKLDGYRRWADPLLREANAKAADDSQEKLHTSLALLPTDSRQVDYLYERLLNAGPTDLPVIRDFLLDHRDVLKERLGKVLSNTQEDPDRRFRAACALATYDPSGDAKGEPWQDASQFVSGQLLVAVQKNPSHYPPLLDTLRPVREMLLGPLAKAYRNQEGQESERSFATNILADYAAESPMVLANLLMDADEKQFGVIFPKFKDQAEGGLPFLIGEIERSLPSDLPTSNEKRETLAKRQANAAVALLRMNLPAKVWPLLKHGPDARVRSYIIHWVGSRGADPRAIVKRLAEEPDLSTRRAVVLALGEFNDTQLPPAERKSLNQELLTVFENEPDPGLHAAAEWLLRRWQHGERLQAVLERLAHKDKPSTPRSNNEKLWFVNSQRQTFVVLDAGEVRIGSPNGEWGRNPDETQYRVRIGRRFAIAQTQVTKAQYRIFQRAVKAFDLANHPLFRDFVRTDDCPQTGMTWYEAAQYCNWLSKEEGLTECYEPNENRQFGPRMKPKEKYLELQGYRLPTEAEWEFACRAGSITSRYYGVGELLLPNYAWYEANAKLQTSPVGSRKPNDFGLFDILGNTWQWCDDAYKTSPDAYVLDDRGSTTSVVDDVWRVLRGAAFYSRSREFRSANRLKMPPSTRNYFIAFRPARTILRGSVTPLTDNAAEGRRKNGSD
jgi:formylglycine-generating enzyme required for sulfatase activity